MNGREHPASHQSKIEALARDVASAAAQGTEQTAYALFQLGNYLGQLYPDSENDEQLKAQISPIEPPITLTEQQKHQIMVMITSAIDRLCELPNSRDPEYNVALPVQTAATILPYLIDQESSINEYSRTNQQKIKADAEDAKHYFQRIVLTTPKSVVLNSNVLKSSTNSAIHNLQTHAFFIEKSARDDNLVDDINRGLVSLNGVTVEDIRPYYSQRLASLYFSCLSTHLGHLLGTAGLVDAKYVHISFYRYTKEIISAVVTCSAGMISGLSDDHETIETPLSGQVSIHYQLKPTEKGDKAFQLKHMTLNNFGLHAVVMNEKTNATSIEKFLDTTKLESYARLALNSILDSRIDIGSQSELCNFLEKMIRLKYGDLPPTPSPKLKSKATKYFYTGRAFLKPKLHRIYQALATIPEASDPNFHTKSIDAYTQVITIALELKLAPGETLEAYLDRAKIATAEKGLSTAIDENHVVTNIHAAKKAIAAPANKDMTFSFDLLERRLNHLIRHEKPLTLDADGLYVFGKSPKAALTFSEDSDNCFEEEGEFDYAKYERKFEKYFSSYITKNRHLSDAQKKQVSHLICHALLQAQPKAPPALSGKIATAIANQMTNNLSQRDSQIVLKILPKIKTKPSPEAQLLEKLADAAENRRFVEKTQKIVTSYEKKSNHSASASQSETDPTIQDFLNLIEQKFRTNSAKTTGLFFPKARATPEGVTAMKLLAQKIQDPELLFAAVKIIAAARLAVVISSLGRNQETKAFYKNILSSNNLAELIILSHSVANRAQG